MRLSFNGKTFSHLKRRRKKSSKEVFQLHGPMVNTEARNLTGETDRDEDDPPSSSMSSNTDSDPTKEPRQQSSSAESSVEESSEEESDAPMDYESPTGMEEGGASDP